MKNVEGMETLEADKDLDEDIPDFLLLEELL